MPSVTIQRTATTHGLRTLPTRRLPTPGCRTAPEPGCDSTRPGVAGGGTAEVVGRLSALHCAPSQKRWSAGLVGSGYQPGAAWAWPLAIAPASALAPTAGGTLPMPGGAVVCGTDGWLACCAGTGAGGAGGGW